MKELLRVLAIGCMLLARPLVAHAHQDAGAVVAVPGWTEAPYDLQNPFARIIRGELPAYKVYDDAHVLAFLSLDQDAPGHVLVISRTSRAQNIMEMPLPDLLQVMRVVRQVARAEVVALHADGVVIQQNNGAAGGQSVFHLHVHVIPHWSGKPPDFARDSQGKLDRRALAARIPTDACMRRHASGRRGARCIQSRKLVAVRASSTSGTPAGGCWRGTW